MAEGADRAGAEGAGGVTGALSQGHGGLLDSAGQAWVPSGKSVPSSLPSRWIRTADKIVRPPCGWKSWCRGGLEGSLRAAMKKDDEIREERERAWIGDAVLALFARSWVLKERGSMDGEWFTRLTSNGFLSAFGQPTRVEAKIGQIYREQGLEAAFVWMEGELIPLFKKQMANR